ncbi:Bug family tripartite tricarboxylate transporter substrate binding protein [Polynucleobacter tropicus]|nr:tripartite tricarboxylate transporter substrate-binding protein [Polynucleobacter tropicus]
MATAVWAVYPDKPIKLIVGFPPGGPTDMTARIIAPKLGDLLKQSIIIENKAGAGGNVAAQVVANSSPDGYTFLFNSAAFAVNPALYGAAAGYIPEKNFVPVIFASTQANVISVNEAVPVKTLAELREYAAKNKLSYSSPGYGTTPHLTCENLFRVQWKLDISHIPYKGAGPASLAVVGGETPIACTAVAGVYQFSKQGKVRILAISSDKRSPNLPEVPTLVELGYPQIKDYTWSAMMAPIKTPNDILLKMNQAVNVVLQMPDVREQMDKAGLVVMGGNLQQANEYMTEEVNRWAQIVKAVGAKVE